VIEAEDRNLVMSPGIIEVAKALKIDLGCGKNRKPADWVGVDSIQFEGVDQVVDLTGPWPWADNSVDEANASHIIEHFTPEQRCHFVNELWRVLKPGAKASIICPNWASNRAYGDPTHQWPPVSDFWLLYLNKKWRIEQAPHTDSSVLPWGFACNFHVQNGFNIDDETVMKSDEARVLRMSHYINTCMDLVATFTKLEADNLVF